MVDLQIAGHWHKNTKVLEHYLRPDIVVLSPQQIYNKRKKYRRDWSVTRLMFIVEHCIETTGDESHPHVVMMNTHYKDYLLHYVDSYPQSHPHPKAIDRMQHMATSVKAGTFTDQVEAQHLLAEGVKQYKSKLAKILRKEALQLARGTKLSRKFYQHSDIGFNKNHSCQTQTDAPQVKESMIQMDEVFFVNKEDLEKLNHPAHLHSSVAMVAPISDHYDVSGQPLYQVQINDQKPVLMSRTDINARKKARPQDTVTETTISIPMAKLASLKRRIKTRISKKF